MLFVSGNHAWWSEAMMIPTIFLKNLLVPT